MKARLIIRKIILLILCMCLILSGLYIPSVFAEVTPGTVEHIADADTTDSYPQLVALRQESRRAGRVWADKSVFTDSITLDMDTDGIKDGTTISNDNGDFLHVFSTLGSSQLVDTKETVPLDVVFILDFSYSMGGGIASGKENTRLYKTLDAVNDAINTLLSDVSSDSRVGVAVYSNTATQFVPLVNLVPEVGKKDTQWLTVDDFGWTFSESIIRMNGKARKAVSKSSWTEAADISTYCNSTTVKTGNATNLQAGIAAGMGMLADEEVTEWQSPRSGLDYDRIPVTIIMTDGGCNTLSVSYDENDTNDSKAWYDTNFTERRNSYADDKDVQYVATVSLPTLLTAAYNTARISSNYRQTPYAYGIAVDTQTVTQTQTPKIQITLDPRTYFNNRATGKIKEAYNYYEQWLASTSDSPLYVGQLPDGYYAEGTKDIYISQLPKGNSPSKEDVAANINYTTKELIQIASTDMDNVFKDIIQEVAGEKGNVFVPVDGSNDVGVSNSLSYMDPIGKYMEVKTVKNVLLFGELYDVNKSDDIEYFDKYDNKITNSEAINNGNYAYSKQYYNIEIPASGDEIVNPCYGSNNATFRLSEIEIYVKKTDNFQDTDVGGGIESDTGNDEALYINIPAMALPMQVATILLDNGNVISYETNVGDKEKDNPDEYLVKKAQSTPLRVFYEVGIAEEIKTANGNVDLTKVNPNYVVQNRNQAGDKVYFYSNWYKENIYNGYVTDGTYTYGDAVLTFSPSSDNRYYVFQNYHPVYANPTNDSTGGVVSGSDDSGWTLNGKSLGAPIKDKIDPKKWYYILVEYYNAEGTVHLALPRLGSEFGSAIGGESGGVSDNEYLSWYDPETGKSIPYMDGDVPAKPPADGNYVIATHPGGLRVGDMAAGIGVKKDENNKSTNNTETSNTYYMPTVSSSTGGENVVINVYLGNNGRLAIHDTQLLVTKTVGTLSNESNEVLRNMKFRYTVKLEKQSGTYNAIKAIRETIKNENGQEETIWRALIKTVELLTNNHGLLQADDGSIATVGYNSESREIIPDGKDYYVYVGGESAGDNFTHTLFDSDEGHSFTEVLGTDKEIPVTAYLVPVGYYGEYWRFDKNDKRLIRKDDFIVGQVERETIGFAIKTKYQSNTTYQTEALHFEDEDNTADFSLRDGEGLLFIGLESGTEYKVTEKLTAAQVEEGVSLSYVTHKENDKNNREKITTYYSNHDTPDDSHEFNDTDHTYSVLGETTSLLTEEVNYFNYPPKANKKQISPDSGFVSVGDEVTYVIYWANDQLAEEDNGTTDVTIRDPLDPGVDFVEASFVRQKNDGSYEKITSPPKEWTCTYNKDKHEVVWTVKDAVTGQSGFVQLTVKVNENAPFAFDENGESLGYPDNMITNKARIVINGYEFSTDTVKTPMDGVHKTEVSVTPPNDKSTDVGTDLGNLNQDAQSGNFVGPQVDKDWEIKYQISFTNYKTEAATITVADKLDPDVSFVSAEYGGVTLTKVSSDNIVKDDNVTIRYDTGTRTVIWTVTDVVARATDQVFLTVKVKSSAYDGDDEESPPTSAPKVFEQYTPSGTGTVLDEGKYIMVYNGNALSESRFVNGNISALLGKPVTITDNTINDSDADDTIVWSVVHGTNGFYLQSAANGKYLKIIANSASFVDDTADATVFTNYSTPGVLQGKNGTATVYFGYYTSDFRGVSFAFYAKAMTFYKLNESESGSGSEEPEQIETPLQEPPSGDYKIHNTASVKVGNDVWQITETMENPIKPITLPETGGNGIGYHGIFGSMLATGVTLWFIEAKRKKRRKC